MIENNKKLPLFHMEKIEHNLVSSEENHQTIIPRRKEFKSRPVAEIVDIESLRAEVNIDGKNTKILTKPSLESDQNRDLKQKLADFESMLNGNTLEAMQKYGQGAKSPEEVVLSMEDEIRRNEKNSIANLESIKTGEMNPSDRAETLRKEIIQDLNTNQSEKLPAAEETSSDLAKKVDVSHLFSRDIDGQRDQVFPINRYWNKTKNVLADSFIGDIWERLSRNYGPAPVKIWAQRKFFFDRYSNKIGRLNQKLDTLDSTIERLNGRLILASPSSSTHFKLSRALAETQTARELVQGKINNVENKKILTQEKISGVAFKLKERVEQRLNPIERKLEVARLKYEEMKDSVVGLRADLSAFKDQTKVLERELKNKTLHKVERKEIKAELLEAKRKIGLMEKVVVEANQRLAILGKRAARYERKVSPYRIQANRYVRLVNEAGIVGKVGPLNEEKVVGLDGNLFFSSSKKAKTENTVSRNNERTPDLTVGAFLDQWNTEVPEGKIKKEWVNNANVDLNRVSNLTELSGLFEGLISDHYKSFFGKKVRQLKRRLDLIIDKKKFNI